MCGRDYQEDKDASLTYIGAHDGVDVALPTGRVVTVMNGETEEFPPEVAESLLSQEGQWKKASAKAKKEE